MPSPLESIESAIDPIIISFTGSIASGKSTFLSALHSALGYDTAGVRIDKDRLLGSRARAKPEAIKKLRKGIFRTNATVRPDSLPVYGVIDDETYEFRFYAPGGHLNSVKLEGRVDGLVYFVDLNLARYCGEELDMMKTLVFGGDLGKVHLSADGDVLDEVTRIVRELVTFNMVFRDDTEEVVVNRLSKHMGIEGNFDEVEDLAEYLAKNSVEDIPVFGLPLYGDASYVQHRGFVNYKGESLGAVLQSLIDCHKEAQIALSRGIAVVGAGTHFNKAYGYFPRETAGLLEKAAANFNNAIAKYAQYRAGHEMPAEQTILDLAGMPIDWYFVELMGHKNIKSRWRDYARSVLNTKNMEVVEIAHEAARKTLEQRGIDSQALRLVTFSKRQSELTVRYS